MAGKKNCLKCDSINRVYATRHKNKLDQLSFGNWLIELNGHVMEKHTNDNKKYKVHNLPHFHSLKNVRFGGTFFFRI